MTNDQFELNFRLDDSVYKEMTEMWAKVLNPQKRRSSLLSGLMWISVFFASFALFTLSKSPSVILAFVFGVFVSFIALIVLSRFAQYRLSNQILGRIAASKAENGPVRILINSDRIVEEKAGATRSWDWNSVDQIYPLDRSTAVLRGIDQILIANSGLDSGRSIAEFHETLERLRTSA